jgi:hypothetical protein
MRVAAIRVFTATQSVSARHVPQPVEGQPQIYSLAKAPVPVHDQLTIEVILEAKGRLLWRKRQSAWFQVDPQDTQNDAALFNALQRFLNSQEILPALRTTARATLVKVGIIPNSVLLARIVDRIIQFQNREENVTIWPLKELNDFTWTKIQRLQQQNPQLSLIKKPERAVKAQWAVYLEKDWSTSAKGLAYMCAIAIICRLAPLVLRQLGLTDGSLDSLTYSLHSTALMGTAGVLYSDRTLSNLFLKFQREDQSPTSMFSSLAKPATARVRSSSVILNNGLIAMIYIAILTNHLLPGLF